MTKIPDHRLTRVRLRNYRSIRSCDVELGALTCLVGPNGSGKSSFLDALQLVGQGLRGDLVGAIGERGGVGQLLSRGAPDDALIEIVLDGRCPGERFRYEVHLAPTEDGSYRIDREWCGVWPDDWLEEDGPAAEFRSDHVSEHELTAEPSRRLYLPSAVGFSEFSPYSQVLELLGRFETFSINPDVVRAPQRQLPGDRLLRDGANLALVLRELERTEGGRSVIGRVVDYLSLIVPDLVGLRRLQAGPWETLEFLVRQEGDGGGHWTFPALSVSDGTLRAAGVLLALFGSGQPAPLGIEEPENALNPAASGILLDALRDAAEQRQVIITTHSPDLVDSDLLGPAELRAVRRVDGATVIDQVDDAARLALTEHLFTAGELLRVDQLQPRSGGAG